MSNASKKIFIGIAWPYVNGNLHIGHVAGYLLPSDIYARFHRLLGNDVLMVSGSDCYGTPITVQADKEKTTPEKIVEKYHKRNVDLFLNKLELSFDLYTKTATDNHQKVVWDFLLVFWKRNLLEIKSQFQYYDESEKRFLPDRYVEGQCLNCGYLESRSDQCDQCGRLHSQDLIEPKSKVTGNKVALKESEHLFIKWPKIEPKIKKYFKTQSPNWRTWVANETRGWLDRGIQERAITRDLDWGIKLPPEIAKKLPKSSQKRIYVWFEAVIGYLSASIEWSEKTGRDWKEFWYEPAEHAYFMGKDNLIFHTIFWPGQLMVYDPTINLPTKPLINQFLNIEGRKFSKSRGVSIDTAEFVDHFGINPLRFYMTMIMPEESDTNFTWADFLVKNNDILVGQIGNYLNRVLTIYKDSLISEYISSEVQIYSNEVFFQAIFKLEKGQFRAYLEEILNLARFANQRIDSLKPWTLKKDDPKKFERVSGELVSLTLVLALLLQSITPSASKEYFEMIGIKTPTVWPQPDQLSAYLKSLLKKIKISQVKPIFKKFTTLDIPDFN